LISDTAKRLAQQNRFGRLDPPVLFALDEAPNVVPLPLHRLTSEARGLGITFVVCVRSRQQVDDVWTSTRGSIIWKNCKVKDDPAGGERWRNAGSRVEALRHL
jgi:hypothetical protein